MANVKISALPAATSVASADVLPIVQSATTKKATIQNVSDALGVTTTVAGSSAGLVYLDTLTISGQSNGSINNVFTSTYTNYRLELNFGAASSNIAYYMRFRASGSDETGSAAYRWAYRGFDTNSAAQDTNSNGANALYIGNVPTTAGRCFTNIDLFSPQASGTYTVANVNTQFHDAGGIMWRGGGGFVLVNTQFDGFTLGTLSAATATVVCRIYGYRQA